MLLLLACTQKAADDTGGSTNSGPSPDIDLATSVDFGAAVLDTTATEVFTVTNEEIGRAHV